MTNTERLLDKLNFECLSISDPREGSRKLQRHKLLDILVIALCSTIVGGEGYEEMHHFGLAKEGWLSSFLELPNGIPSTSTFQRVISGVDSKEFGGLLIRSAEACSALLKGNGVAKRTVAIDGKTIRGSHKRCENIPALHTISAFDTENGLALAQLNVSSKSNEIIVIPELLKLLSIESSVVTIDAIGCQKKIISEIKSKKAGFVLALKKNQSTLYNIASEAFSCTESLHTHTQAFHTTDGDHGRIEQRSYLAIDTSNIKLPPNWSEVKTIIAVDSTREIKGQKNTERRFYISDQPENSATLAHYIRSHWKIENSLHWVLDVTYNEDSCRIRTKHAAANMAILRKTALNLIKTENTPKMSKRIKRFRAGLDNNMMCNILFQSSVLQA